MNCSRARARLVAHIDDELAPGEVVQLRQHLDGCPSCRHRHDTLLADLPRAPTIRLDPARRHGLHLLLEDALDATDGFVDAPPRRLDTLRDALGAEVGVPRGLLVLYAAALILAVGWAAGRALPSPDVGGLTQRDAEAETAASLELHRPAAYVPEGGWF
jgi:anti-sigma factor RsiW